MNHRHLTNRREPEGLYDPRFERDACGVGFVCHIKGEASHAIIRQGLELLENLDHRGACGCDPLTGDGAGMLLSMPDKLLRRSFRETYGTELPPRGEYAVAQVFFPRNHKARAQHELLLEKILTDYDMTLLGWRDVPVRSEVLGEVSRACEPVIRQAFIGMRPNFYNPRDFERRLYLLRQRVENLSEYLELPGWEDFYICCCSTNRMVYKGMLTTAQLGQYFPDLSDPDMQSHLALVHSRFSTNTFPSWLLAHPYRYLAHNGEINALRGNRNWMRARRGSLRSPVFGAELDKLFPLFSESVSDSATLDSALQFLVVNGRSLPHAILMLIPEAWDKHQTMDPDLKAFYEYHACLMEPWDGPAAIAFTNGQMIGAVLDRNGLRPARYIVTHDDLVVMASEVGVLDIPNHRIKKKWRLQPGKIFLVDTLAGRIVHDEEIKNEMIDKRPWRRWIDHNMIHIDKLPDARSIQHRHDDEALLALQHVFGYTSEELRIFLQPMSATGEDPIGSMGTDTPLACLSDRPRSLFDYFKQLFAQVTNPPLDAIREELVTSLVTYMGRQGNLFDESPEVARLIRIDSPILTEEQLEKVRNVRKAGFQCGTVEMLYDATRGEIGLREALDRVRDEAARAVREGVSLLVLSDRGVTDKRAPIPALLATAAVHHHLVREGTRTQTALIVETGEVRDVHACCLLVGYGAEAINPYLAFETIEKLERDGFLPEGLDAEHAIANFVKALNKGMLKVASKMGISTIQSYRGAQIFEAIGLNRELVAEYFTGTASRIDGIGLDVIEKEAAMRHRRGYPRTVDRARVLDSGGHYMWRADGEFHMWNPTTVAKLQHAVRGESYTTYKQFADAVNNESRQRCTLRGLLGFVPRESVPIDEVEPATEIVKRFVTGAMSLGSISTEVHETIAKAMNRLGGKSNTGEGGEDPGRYVDDRRSAIKQIASGRFGVTAEYLANADELQIKMAQGAKPGEGGQLPGHKVSDYIAKVRHSTPGVGLISPPPHHDIYSIEDLAQLIHDLKNSNPRARVSVKLVSEVGVGTVAAGVAKAKADHILISGDGGGTGASPQTSIKHAGIPWEMGLAETQQTLVMNGLRGRVVLQTDGQLKTGRDVVVAALLGAEEFGFSTAPLIATGCILMRVCHKNTCPVGIATQDPELRKKFQGTPDHIVAYFMYVAEEVREIMAQLGVRKLTDLIGHVEWLAYNPPADHWKARSLDMSMLLHKPSVPADAPLYCVETQDHGLDRALDNTLIGLSQRALDHRERVRAELPIRNINRTVGTMLSYNVARRFGHEGLPNDTIRITFRGSAGQSFGAFLARGISFELVGDANDYLGKGLSGGRIVLRPPDDCSYVPEENIIAGNVIGYGATCGEIYVRGVVGERFCVRNSGASAVVEGVGDHGCEYMTGGRVVVIGQTGRNFAAGMSGGVAYVFDADRTFAKRCNTGMVDLEELTAEDEDLVRSMLESHRTFTRSTVAARLLEHWDQSRELFVKVMPRDYRRVLEQRKALEESAALVEKGGKPEPAAARKGKG
ncbi:MAG: glutamate synthase large subunit [Candidatus Sumerlaeia bacterium]|nr:glutamate synthase large subunit [Candidatus Sumerlaeia bacterium]